MQHKTKSNYEITKPYYFDPFIPMVGGLLAGLYIGGFGNKKHKMNHNGLKSKL